MVIYVANFVEIWLALIIICSIKVHLCFQIFGNRTKIRIREKYDTMYHIFLLLDLVRKLEKGYSQGMILTKK